MIKAILIKPLDGDAEGTEREFSKTDFEHLEKLGAVRHANVSVEKAAPTPLNKKAPEVANKAAENKG